MYLRARGVDIKDPVRRLRVQAGCLLVVLFSGFSEVRSANTPKPVIRNVLFIMMKYKVRYFIYTFPSNETKVGAHTFIIRMERAIVRLSTYLLNGCF